MRCFVELAPPPRPVSRSGRLANCWATGHRFLRSPGSRPQQPAPIYDVRSFAEATCCPTGTHWRARWSTLRTPTSKPATSRRQSGYRVSSCVFVLSIRTTDRLSGLSWRRCARSSCSGVVQPASGPRARPRASAVEQSAEADGALLRSRMAVALRSLAQRWADLGTCDWRHETTRSQRRRPRTLGPGQLGALGAGVGQCGSCRSCPALRDRELDALQ